MRLHRQVEALIHCLGPGSVGVVVASASILGACESAVGESPGKGSADAAFDASEAVASEDLELLVGLEVRDDVLRLGVGDDVLEANQIVVLVSVRGAYDGQERVTLGLVCLAMGGDLGSVCSLHGAGLQNSCAGVGVRNANIKDEGPGCMRQSDKDISLVVAVSMLGHGRLRVSALHVCGACG